MRLTSLQLFATELTTAAARIRAQLAGHFSPDEHLEGLLAGPRSRYSTTLPVRTTFHSVAQPAGLAAEAILPDPCFWTPDLPLLYDVEIALKRGSSVVATINRPLALRPLAVSRTRLRMAGTNWVLRAIDRGSTSESPLADWHALGAAMSVDFLDDALCRQASELGVLLVVELSAASDLPRQLQALAVCPAVGLVLIDGASQYGSELRQAAPNLLLVQLADGPAFSPVSWAHALMADASNLDNCLDLAASATLPVLARRQLPAVPSLHEARQACDTLQRDLAERATARGQGLDIAGYLV